jgi:hypothetical protein
MAMGGSAPTDGNEMSTREHWDGCPSVFDLRGDLSPRPSLKGRGLCPLGDLASPL